MAVELYVTLGGTDRRLDGHWAGSLFLRDHHLQKGNIGLGAASLGNHRSEIAADAVRRQPSTAQQAAK